MSTSVMRRQIERLQEDLVAMKPRPARQVRLVAQPGPEASVEERRAHAEALQSARAQGGGEVSLIVLAPLTALRRA